MTVDEFLNGLEEPRRSDALALHQLIRKAVPQFEPFLAKGAIGYGKYRYRCSTGEADWYRIGLAPLKSGISLHVVAVDEKGWLAEQAKAEVGKAVVGKSCIRFKRLSDLDLDAVERLIRKAATTKAIAEVGSNDRS